MGEEKIKVCFRNENGGKVTRKDGEYSIEEICEMLCISSDEMKLAKKRDITWESAICNIRGTCYINIFGNLVIPVEAIDCK